MGYILDTHTILWFIEGDTKLSKKAKTIIENTEEAIFISIVSLWEIAIKINIGKLKVSAPIDLLIQHLKKQDISILEISNTHLVKYTDLPLHHRDPFDRMIIVQAQEENLTILGMDESFALYETEILW